MRAVALTIAGSDPSGGAGIQADLKAFHQWGVYGEAVITLVTVQNSVRVSRVETLDPELVGQQIAAVMQDIPPAAVKTGALGNAAVIEAVASSGIQCPLIVDPVMVSKHGAALVDADAVDAMKAKLLPKAALVTPNIPEAEALTGRPVADVRDALRRIRDLGSQAVLIKGGHREGEPIDYLLDGDGFEEFPGKRVQTKHTHGTGCTYSAAITAAIAKGATLRAAISAARLYIQRAIETAPGFGSGSGPVNHFAAIAE